jgi:hypothetical protein
MKFILFVTIIALFAVSCTGGHNTNQSSGSASEQAAVKALTMQVNPASASLALVIDGENYAITEATMEKNFLPPVFFRPYDPEEDTSEDNRDKTLLSISGTLTNSPSTTITFEMLIEGKPKQGKVNCSEGTISIGQKQEEGLHKTNRILKLEEATLSIQSLKELTFANGITGYAIDCTFEAKTIDSFSSERGTMTGAYRIAY